MKQQTFLVSRFVNRNGVTSWRVDGGLHGLRIRRNFKTREAAAADKATLELKAEQDLSGLHSVSTSLENDQVREAKAAFRHLEGRTRSLTFYLDYALANFRDPSRDMPLAEAIKKSNTGSA